MRNILLFAFILSLTLIAFAESETMKAMELELERSMQNLQMEDMEKPYFISYRIGEENGWQMLASGGSVIRSIPRNSRRFYAEVRVGNYELDNTNFISRNYWLARRPGNLPIEEDINSIRYRLWKKTDNVYKLALENLARKKSVLQQSQQEQQNDDFTREETVISLKARNEKIEFTQEQWTEKLETLSQILDDNNNIQRSSVSFYASMLGGYFANTEGTRISSFTDFYETMAIAIAQADDGTYVVDSKTDYFKSENDIDWKSLEESYHKLSDRVSAMKNADTLDYYFGPVLFKDQASAEYFYQLLSSRVSAPAKPLNENKNRNLFQNSQNDFENKLTRRVSSVDISVYDDPSIKDFNGVNLLGHYEFDDEGVPGQRVDIIKNGVLNSFLMSRRPFRYMVKSNGHGRFQGSEIQPLPSNMFIESNKAIAEDKIMKEFMGLVKEEGLEYGIAVEKLSTGSLFQSSSARSVSKILSKLGSGFKGLDTDSDINPPLIFYKVYPDGHREYLRKMAFADISGRSLRDIEIASKEKYVHNFVTSLGYSVIAPKAIVVSDIELIRLDMSGDKLPIIAKGEK